ncbi:MAG TPA: glycosyltransferase family 1 protein [Chromatiaceae bacterium]|nr:glycosyltransferase family 1 protein [Chromatiaceae bacterium]
MSTKIAIIRQEQTGGDGGAEAIIDIILEVLGAESRVNVSLLCRRWNIETNDNRKIILNPLHLGRTLKYTTFVKAVKKHLKTHQYDLTQSHERLTGCDIFRAGDGVHKVWLQQKAKQLNPVSRWLLYKQPFHKTLMSEEKKMFESNQLKAVICNSEMVGNEILEHFDISPEKVHIIYNGVDIKQFNPNNKINVKQIRRTLNVPEKCTLFIFPGSGFERKNLASVIHALSQLPENTHLIVAGRDKRQRRYENLVKKTNTRNRVHFLGAINKKDMPGIYAAADVLVLPTLYDPFPNVILEGMATGLPCITSHKCGAAAIIKKENAGQVVDALNINELAEAMTIYLSRKAREWSGLSARKTAENFTTQAMQKKLLSLYQSIIEKPSR